MRVHVGDIPRAGSHREDAKALIEYRIELRVSVDRGRAHRNQVEVFAGSLVELDGTSAVDGDIEEVDLDNVVSASSSRSEETESVGVSSRKGERDFLLIEIEPLPLVFLDRALNVEQHNVGKARISPGEVSDNRGAQVSGGRHQVQSTAKPPRGSFTSTISNPACSKLSFHHAKGCWIK